MKPRLPWVIGSVTLLAALICAFVTCGVAQAQACAVAIHEPRRRFGPSAGSALLSLALTVARRTPFGAMLRPPADGAAFFFAMLRSTSVLRVPRKLRDGRQVVLRPAADWGRIVDAIATGVSSLALLERLKLD